MDHPTPMMRGGQVTSQVADKKIGREIAIRGDISLPRQYIRIYFSLKKMCRFKKILKKISFKKLLGTLNKRFRYLKYVKN